MTRPDLEAIEARANGATPGPWWRAHHAAWEVEAPPNQVVADCGTVDAASLDARFIAAARADIPTLVAYARELEAVLRAPTLAHRCADGGVRAYPAVVCAKGCGGEAVDLVAAVAELEATLLNDRGEGAPPEPGWEPYLHNGRVRWSRELADGVYDIVREASDAPGWLHRHRHLAGHVTGTDGHPTARAAMNAADAAIRASKVPA